MRVQFPLSKKYCEDTDWQRHKKATEIFGDILNEVITLEMIIFIKWSINIIIWS